MKKPLLSALVPLCLGWLLGSCNGASTTEQGSSDSSTTASDQPRPNIVLCLADDWGWPHAGVYGDPVVKTPTFDRLAGEGILFDHAYVASPSCTPSRNSLVTGKYFWELGSGANLWSTLPAEHESFIHLLEDAGYDIGRTWAKTWGPGDQSSWEEVHGQHVGGPGYETIDDFLAERGQRETPFFFWLGTSDPHRGYEEGSGSAAGIPLDSIELFDFFPDAQTVRSDVADYYYEVQRWDSLVGDMMATLAEKNLLENTIIIMTGDHGMPFPRAKGNLYDAGVRVPFAIRWGTQVAEGQRTEAKISFVDVAPTLLELAEAPVPPAMTGSSFAMLLQTGQAAEGYDRSRVVFGRERHVPAQERPNMAGYPMRGLRTEDFLYIRNYKPTWWPAGTGDQSMTNMPDQWYADVDGGPTKTYMVDNKDKDEEHSQAFALAFGKRPAEELYDSKNDPDQLHNLAEDPAYAKQLAAHRQELNRRLEELNDPRATEPAYEGFDAYPYLGYGGGKR